MAAVSLEHLPPEILQFIFTYLNLTDIGHCSQTCRKWKYLISEFFKNKGKVEVIR